MTEIKLPLQRYDVVDEYEAAIDNTQGPTPFLCDDGFWVKTSDVAQLEAAYAEQIESNRLLMENNEKLRAKCKTMLSDSCETDDDVRKTARGVITDFEIDGDEHGVPVVEDIVESLAKKIIELEAERDALQSELAELRDELHAICGAFWRLDTIANAFNYDEYDGDGDYQAWVDAALDVVNRFREKIKANT